MNDERARGAGQGGQGDEDLPDLGRIGADSARKAQAISNVLSEQKAAMKFASMLTEQGDAALRQEVAMLREQLQRKEMENFKSELLGRLTNLEQRLISSPQQGNGSLRDAIELARFLTPKDSLEQASRAVDIAKGLASIEGQSNEYTVRQEEMRLKERWAEARLALEERERRERLQLAAEQQDRLASSENKVFDLAKTAVDQIVTPLFKEAINPAIKQRINTGAGAQAPPRPPTEAERQAAIGQLDALIATATQEKEKLLTITSASPPPIGTGPWPAGNPAPPAVFPTTPVEAAPISQGQLIPYRPPIIGKIYGPGGEQA